METSLLKPKLLIGSQNKHLNNLLQLHGITSVGDFLNIYEYVRYFMDILFCGLVIELTKNYLIME